MSTSSREHVIIIFKRIHYHSADSVVFLCFCCCSRICLGIFHYKTGVFCTFSVYFVCVFFRCCYRRRQRCRQQCYCCCALCCSSYTIIGNCCLFWFFFALLSLSRVCFDLSWCIPTWVKSHYFLASLCISLVVFPFTAPFPLHYLFTFYVDERNFRWNLAIYLKICRCIVK